VATGKKGVKGVKGEKGEKSVKRRRGGQAMGWRAAVLAAIVCGASAAVCAAEEWSIPITVEEPLGLARTAEPVSGGIPLPQGMFKPGQAFTLLDGAAAAPVQVLPLVVDEKGFMRWVLLDFQTDLAANAKKTFTLRPGPAAAPAKSVRVTKTDGGVTVDTGAVTFTIAADKPFSLVSVASVGGKPVTIGGEVAYTDGFDGKRYVADKPESITVEYEGPMRTTVCVKGRFVGDAQTGLRYIARLTAWAGRSSIHVKYSLANSNSEHYTFRKIKDSTVSLGLGGKVEATVVGASRPLAAAGDVWMQQSMRVVPSVTHGNDSLSTAPWLRAKPGAAGPGGGTARSGDQELWTSAGQGDVAEGWLAVKAGDARLFVSDLYFVEDPPRRLAVTGNAVALTGVTEPLEGTEPPFADRTRWLFDCSHLSSQYVVDFAAPSEAAALSLAAKRARGALHALAPCAWYFESEALPVGTFGTLADELKCYDIWGWKYAAKDVTRGPVAEMAAVPRWVAADDNHFTSEQDTLDALFLMYVRTGMRRFYEAGEAWANYFMDLQTWRTDDWRWKDGGVWWTSRGSPIGSSPQRGADPVVGMRNRLILADRDLKPGTYSVKDERVPLKIDLSKEDLNVLHVLANAKECHCHNWGEGLAQWFLITGDRDAFDAAIDAVEQNYDTQRRAFGKAPGKSSPYSRDFTRACYLTNAARLIAPTDPFVIEASDYLASVYLKRPDPEPRGFLNGPSKVDLATIRARVGPNGLARMKELGITLDERSGELFDPKTGAKWQPVVDPQTWMFPPLSRAMETYYRITGNEDALDWLVAYGQAVAHILYQPKHGNLCYSGFLVDFPVKGFAQDLHSWNLPEGVTDGRGEPINGYLARFYPDVPARAYELTGDPFLKQRAYDFWNGGSHRGHGATQNHNVGGVGKWVNVYTTHDESASFTGKTFYVWAHPKSDEQPPAAVTDLKVAVAGEKATVTFTAPADQGGGKVVRYQVKCSDKPIVDYATFLKKFAANEDAQCTNYWLAANVTGEPAASAPGAKVAFTVAGVSAGAKFFVVCSFDDSSNRSPISNVAAAE
jgi:hypothetical protein